LQKLTTTKVIDVEEEEDHPRPVAAATATVAAAISGRVDELEKGGNRGFGFGGEKAASIYGGEISNTVT
jgi:hypothetical protein